MAQQLARPVPANAGYLERYIDCWNYQIKSLAYGGHDKIGALDVLELSLPNFSVIMKLLQK
jgi:hypothetical protein